MSIFVCVDHKCGWQFHILYNTNPLSI